MPPEPLPWDRKDFFKERKHERFSDSVGSVSRWRETTPHSSRDFARWGQPDLRTRPPGQGKQGGWHIYSEESGHGFTPSRSNEKILDDESCRPYGGSRADGKYIRNSSREYRGGSFSQKDWKGHSWENGSSPNGHGPARPVDVNDQRSVHDNKLTHNTHLHSDFVNTWDQLHSKEQHDKTGSVNGLGTGQKLERENSLRSIDWKPLKWTRSGSLSSRGSGFSHSGSSKSMGVDSIEVKGEAQIRNVTPLQSPSGDAAACETSAALSEDASSRKKPRLKWGEGLAKYEKKKVDPGDCATKHGMDVFGSLEPVQSHASNLADKSPRAARFSDCASPATPSSVACSSSPGVEDKPFVKAANIDNDTCNLSGSPSLHSQNHLEEGREFNLETLELTPIANLSTSLSELLQSDDPGSVDSSFLRSTAITKLLVWKGDVLKALEMTESEIDSLENELKLLISESGNCSCPVASRSLHGECQEKPCEELVVVSNLIPRPSPLQLVSSGDMIVEKAVGSLEKEHADVRDEDVDSPGTVTSRFVELHSSAKGAALTDLVKHAERSGDLDASESRNMEAKCSVHDSNEEMTEGLSTSEGGDELIANKNCAASVDVNFHCDREDTLYDLILASNKESANRASAVFNKLLPSDECHIDISKTIRSSIWPNDPLIEEKFAMRKRFSRFKERVITLKFRAFQHIWKEDMRLLSIRKNRAKSQKRSELSLRTPHGSYQKHRSSIRSRFSSPAGISTPTLAPTKESINFTRKLLSDLQFKIYRNSLKMPALILDKKESICSRFISSNGLIEDPCAIEKERAMINPWTTEEKETFLDKLATLGKDFRTIASFLDHKTTADCVEFYYKNHKSDCFAKTKKKPEFAKLGKSCSTSNYLVTSGKRWNRMANAASLDMLGVASAIAANADNGMQNQEKATARFLMGVTGDYRASQGDEGIMERSGGLEIFGNERETVAADVLAGIGVSLSSEAMSSCITSSFDPGESCQNWKCQKVGSLTKRPLTPEVTQNVDDESCSDESCGEMDPTDWTDEEKSIFMQAVSSYGKDFMKISRCVRTKSRDQCKVFFSKARKCLGLDMIHHVPGDEGMPISDDATGGGSDNEDACVTGSVVCSEKSVSKMDEDLILSDLNINHCEPDPAETMDLQNDPNRSEENNETGQFDCKDPEFQVEHLVTVDLLADSKPEVDFDGDSKMEDDVDGMPVIVQTHENAILPPDTEVEGDEAAGDGACLGEPVSAKEANDHGLPVSGAEGETIAVSQSSTVCFTTEVEVQQMVSENKQDENRDANASGPSNLNCSNEVLHTDGASSDPVPDANAPLEIGVGPKEEQKIALELSAPQVPSVISLEQDVSLVNANSIEGPAASQYEKTLKQDTPLTLALETIRDQQCQKSTSADDYNQHQSINSVLGCAESGQILRGYPLAVSAKKEMNGDITSRKLASLQCLSKAEGNFHSDLYFLQKCKSSKARSSVAELPFLSQDQKSNHSRPHSLSSSDTEKPCRNGDVKLFGQILTHPSSQQKQNTTSDIQENEDKGVQHPKFSSKNSNLKFTGTHSLDANSTSSKFDRNNYLDLENVPVRSYGFWDGNRIQTGFSTFPDSAILLAKYPAAFGSYSTLSNAEQQPLHSVVKSSNECNLNGVSVFSSRDMSSSNGVAEYQLYRNREGTTRVKPFAVDMKQQRPDMLFSEMQRRNGTEAVSSIQQQARGMVGINVVGRGGILVGGARNGISDPVAAIKMHYAKTEQYNGQTASIVREEESWRGKGDIGR
ncbi:hypothetical protein ACSBR2_026689 [Camellia fascicularis]